MRAFAFLTVCLGLIGSFPASAQTREQKAQALINAYPGHLAGFDGVNLIWKDGTRSPFGEDRADKPLQELDGPARHRRHVPLALRLRRRRIPGKPGERPRPRAERGFLLEDIRRLREAAGRGCASVTCASSAPLKSVPWVSKFSGGSMQATSVNGVDEKLRLISKELEALGPSFGKYLVPSGGSFVPRCIAGTTRLSVHSFGIAVDINPQYGGYWQYGLPHGMSEEQVRQKKISLVYKNRIPIEIVKVFEKHGFIWGGNWYHFDGMHFEYRPEFLALRAIMSQ